MSPSDFGKVSGPGSDGPGFRRALSLQVLRAGAQVSSAAAERSLTVRERCRAESAQMTLGDDFAATFQAARLGDDTAVGLLYRDVNPRLLAYIRARAPLVAEDLNSEVWLAVAKGLARFDGDDERAWHGYLFSIARRQIAGHWRQAKRRRTDPVGPEAFAERSSSCDVEAEGIESVANSEAVGLIVRHLSPEQAEVVLLRVIAGLDVEEVAAILGKQAGAIRALQHRGLKRLGERLTGLAVTP
jgi:RNA polymerase sigma-70 factor (ECF subfamily)